MKRSEMLQILQGSVYENIDSYGGLGLNTDNFHKILDDLEAAGMLPPPIYKEVHTLNDEGIIYTCRYSFRPNEKTGNHESNWEKE